MPLHQLRGMPLSDLALYQRYTDRRMFPSRRVEKLLAQIPMVMAQLKGQTPRLSDFLFDPRDEAADQARRQREMDEFFNS